MTIDRWLADSADQIEAVAPGHPDVARFRDALGRILACEGDSARLDWLAETHGATLAGLLPDRWEGEWSLRDLIDMAAGTWPDAPGDGPS